MFILHLVAEILDDVVKTFVERHLRFPTKFALSYADVWPAHMKSGSPIRNCHLIFLRNRLFCLLQELVGLGIGGIEFLHLAPVVLALCLVSLLVVVPAEVTVALNETGLLASLQIGLGLFAAQFPEIGNSDDVEILGFAVVKECWEQCASEPVGITDDSYVDPVIRAYDPGIAGCTHAQASNQDAGRGHSGGFKEFSSFHDLVY